MKRYFISLFMFLSVNSTLLAQQLKCNRAVIYPYLKTKLDSSFCIPFGYHITEILDKVDLNGDGIFDKVVQWHRVKLNDADTVFYSIYVGLKTGKSIFYRQLNNLRPLYFRNYDFESKTGNKFYDSIKSNYSYPTLSEVEFQTNTISLKFYTDAATIKKISFTYSLPKSTWILTREMQWFAPTRYEDDRKLEFDRPAEISIKIEDFNMLKYIGW